MILKDIHIDGFGIFNDVSMTFRSGINIITGRNEAGKSTLQKFIRFALFGYRPREPRMEPLRGGRLGGSVKVLMRSGEQVLLERKENQLTVYQNDTPVKENSRWISMLSNASDSLFRNIYAFSLDDMNDTASFEESGIEDRIFSISTGLGKTSVGEISAAILEKAETIYKPAGKIQKIPLLLKAIEEKQKNLDTRISNLSSYTELRKKLTELTESTAALEKEIAIAEENRNKLDIYLKCYDSFIIISDLDAELALLPGLATYPADGTGLLSELEKEEKLYREKSQGLNEGTDEEKGIKQLETEYSALEFRYELVSMKGDADILTGRLELFNQALYDKQELDHRVEGLSKEIGSSLKTIGSDWTEKNVTDLDEMMVYQDRIRKFRSDFELLSRKRLEKETLLNASNAGKKIVSIGNMMNLASILIFLASIPFFIYNLPAGGVVFILAAISIFVGKKYILVQDPTKAIIDELEKIAGEEKEVREEYGIFLTDVLHLNGVLSFEAADKALTLVNELKKKIFERDQAAENARSKKKFIDGFEEIIGKFTGIVQFESEEPVLRARQILREYSHDVQISGEKTKLRERIDAMKLNLRRTEEKLTVLSEKIDSLLTSAGATGREDFRKKYETNTRVAKLLEAKKSELLTIEKIAGKGNGDKLLKFWMENDREAIANQFVQLSNELKKKNEDFKNNKESIGSQKQHLEQIEDQSSVAEQMTIIETEKKKLVAEYHNWIANKLAIKILSDVRGKFEREQQPEVIRNTSGLFSKITNGNFARIGVSMDKKEITVFDSRDMGRNIGQLSRGTREQLLLTMRLGFIREYEKTCEPLPLVVDEIFVNFDPERTHKTAEIFEEFACDRQVIIFTCHPSTAGYFNNVNLIEL